jgi:hypothetical protein
MTGGAQFGSADPFAHCGTVRLYRVISRAKREAADMLSSDEIANAKKRTNYLTKDVHHEHDDCIRIAYEWLDAQATTKGLGRLNRPLKHIIERWGGRYVSQSDVEVAAEMHPKIRGRYPYFNISARLVQPSDARLKAIKEAKTQQYSIRETDKTYSSSEDAALAKR